MTSPYFITALCTPLTDDEQLHREGLDAHIHDQLEHGIDGLLVGGTMGAMQLLSDPTYLDLVQQSIQFNAGRAELLVGVGDTSYVRTRDRIRLVEDLEIDGVVIITPYFFKFRQIELIQYCTSLADVSRKPVYLYDLPGLTGSKLEVDTVLKVLEHPNIHGIKCSDHFVNTRPLIDQLGDRARVIVAQPLLMDVLLKSGVREHLDGIFGLVPQWMQEMKKATVADDWAQVTRIQNDLSELLKFLLAFPAPILSSASEVLRQRGIPGNIAPAPMPRLTPPQQEIFANTPIVQKAIQGFTAPFVSS
ncbi:dihydrodipicolinate synthase family protein [Planctomicrobium sp. SH661]|uniref:dihydrodipicolinate synthase family protein n=1 Tax=Planctomicrobium sp. SH661 TaxID=3448124 RepID=UPI003F5C2147